MNIDAIQKLLEEAGVQSGLGEWVEAPAGPRAEPEIVQRQKDMLRKVASLIEAQLERDHATVADLQERVNRLRHGGGV